MSLKLIWSGLLCGAALLGCQGLRSAVAASVPSAVDVTPADRSLPVLGPDRVALPAGEGNEDSSFPYAVIMERNPFRLNPPPPPQVSPPPPAPDLPTVILSGFRTQESKTVVMMAVKYKKTAKDAESTTYMSLTEGQKQGPVELLKIAPGGDEVTIMNSGTTKQVLNMKDNGFGSKGAGGPATAGVIRNPAPAGGSNPNPPTPAPSAGASAQPNRVVNVGPSAGTPSSRHSGDMIVGGYTGGEPSRTATTPQPTVIASGNAYSGSPATYTSGLLTGGYVAPAATPAQTITAPASATVTGGTPPNFAYTNAVTIPSGQIPTPPMPSLPTKR